MPSKPLSVGALGDPSAHVLNLRDARGGADSAPSLPGDFKKLRHINFIPAAIHDRSVRWRQRFQESGWDELALGLLIAPPVVIVLTLAESLGASRLARALPVFPRKDAVRGAAMFLLLALLLVLPVKLFFVLPSHLMLWRQQLTEQSAMAVSQFEGGASALVAGDAQGARESFLSALDRLRELASSVGVLATAASAGGGRLPLIGAAVDSPLAGVEVGRELAAAGVFFTDGLTLLTHGFGHAADAAALEKAQDALRAAHTHAAAAAAAFDRVDVRQFPSDMAAKAASARKELAGLLPSLATLPDRVGLLSNLLGQQRLMRYLLVFENNAELRPGGGFAGSIALVDVDRGRLTHIEVPQGGSYDLQGSQKLELAAPEPLKRFHARWEFQDTNWFSDWPTSARTMMTFYEKGGGPSVDGVIALTTTSLEELLAVTGPIALPRQHVTLSKENAFTVLESAIQQQNATGSVRPKAVLRPAMEALLARVFAMGPNELARLLPGLERLVRGRHLMVYLADPAQQHAAVTAGLAGEIRDNPGGDYLSVVSANIGGGKSDRVIEDTVSLETTVEADGHVEGLVRVHRTHHGSAGEPFVGVPNISYLRFYVPEGSTLISASGFIPEARFAAVGHADPSANLQLAADPTVEERPGVGTVDPKSGTRITEEFGKTVFGNWFMVDPATSGGVELRYRLPFTLPLTSGVSRYTLLVQKQPGTQGQTFRVHLVLPVGWVAAASAPRTIQESGSAEASLDRDQVFAVLLVQP